MNKEELFECLSGLSQTNNLRDGIDIRKEEANIIVNEIERLNNIINKAIEYHDNCINNLLDLDKIDDNERLAYKVAYGIHDEYLNILKGSEKE